ncbi:MAG TPA: RDD family protein [Verrucomicrobiales bacterium]|nr:RDD family protein [Verrucomicrobiales bacterium]
MSPPPQPPLDTMQRIELAEGVEVELHPAGPMVRALAYLIDFLWNILLLLGLGLLIAVIGNVFGGGIGMGAAGLLLFAAYWGYNVLFEAGPRAATPGKRSMGLKVVSVTGGPASLGSIMLRNVARAADVMPLAMVPLREFGEAAVPVPTYFAGLLCCLFTSRFQRLGDIAARTLVVYANPSLGTGHKVPPPLPGTAPHPPPVVLTREERSAVVRFQERSSLWSQARREELAAHASGLTRVPAPDGVQDLTAMGVWLRDS